MTTTNQKTYKIKVNYRNEDYRFLTAEEIVIKFKIPKSTIWAILKGKYVYKWKEYNITRIKEPVYKKIRLTY